MGPGVILVSIRPHHLMLHILSVDANEYVHELPNIPRACLHSRCHVNNPTRQRDFQVNVPTCSNSDLLLGADTSIFQVWDRYSKR